MPGGKKPIPGGSSSDQKAYEATKKSLLKSGKPVEAAKRIAAAVTNKRRAEEGRTKKG